MKQVFFHFFFYLFYLVPKIEQLASKKTVVLTSKICYRHYVPKWHLEKPERLMGVMAGMEVLKEEYPDYIDILPDVPPVSRYSYIGYRNIYFSRDILLLAHEDSYLRKIEAAVPKSEIPMHVSQLSQDIERDPEDRDTWMSSQSYEAALRAAGSVVKAIDLVHKPYWYQIIEF